MKRLYFIFVLSLISGIITAQQIAIPRIEMMPNLPSPYLMRDWKNVTLGYDSLVFNLNLTGQYLPLSSLYNNTINYPNHSSFKLHTVVGTTSPNSAEAINLIPAVIGSSLSGINKSSQNGNNWVLMCEEFFNKRPEENIYLNHPVSSSGDDWWYETMPNVFFYQLNYLYPNTGDFNYQFTTVADRWLEAADSMGGSITPWHMSVMYYRAFNFSTMTPNPIGVIEPEAAGAIAWILYNAYVETGLEKYRIGAEWCIEFLDSISSNPSYELQLPYGVYAAARMNAEIGTNYNIEKLLNWCFNIGPLRQWGAIVGTWGGYDVSGLIGESIDNDYAFLMNTFEHAGALVPMVRYDDRFSRAIGKWVLNASNAARLFYTNYLPDNHQDSEEWAHQYDPNSYIGHEALRENQNGVSPYATGDAISGGWGLTNLALYGSSHVGIFGGIIDTTNVPGILKLDLLKTDYYRDSAYSSFLYYNPHNEVKQVLLNTGSGMHNIYDAAANTFIQNNVTGEITFPIQPDAAMLLVIVPAGGNTTYQLNKTLYNNIVIDYSSGITVSNYPPRIKSLASLKQTILFNASTQVFCTAEDREGGALIYEWTYSAGSINGSGSEVTFTAPAAADSVIIRCIVTDPGSLKDTAYTYIKIVEFINQLPEIERIKASPRKIDLGGTSELTCIAFDPDGDTLTYNWTSASGSFSGTGYKVNWTAPSAPGNYLVTCSISDGNGGTDIDSLLLSVRDLSITQTGDLAAFYPFNSNANDESGNGNNGTVHGAVLTSDRFGNPNSAYSFDGNDDYILVPNSTSLNFQNSASINFWLINKEFFQREAYPLSHGNWENRWKISVTNKKIRWTIKTGTGIKDLDSETELVNDSLYNITAMYDGSDFEIYMNGELDAFSNWSGQISNTTIDLTIGQALPDNSEYNFKGILDDIRIYNYAIPYSEVKNLYVLSVDDKNKDIIPEHTSLYQNFPNPFNPFTEIRFEIAHSANTKLIIYNLLGEKIGTLLDEFLSPGIYYLRFDGAGLASGLYFYELRTDNNSFRKKMMLLK